MIKVLKNLFLLLLICLILFGIGSYGYTKINELGKVDKDKLNKELKELVQNVEPKSNTVNLKKNNIEKQYVDIDNVNFKGHNNSNPFTSLAEKKFNQRVKEILARRRLRKQRKKNKNKNYGKDNNNENEEEKEIKKPKLVIKGVMGSKDNQMIYLRYRGQPHYLRVGDYISNKLQLIKIFSNKIHIKYKGKTFKYNT